MHVQIVRLVIYSWLHVHLSAPLDVMETPYSAGGWAAASTYSLDTVTFTARIAVWLVEE